jgi:hypothetical protein
MILITLLLSLLLYYVLRLGPPTHHTFSVLPVVADFIAIASALGQIYIKISDTPLVQKPASDKAENAFKGLQDSLEELDLWMRVTVTPTQSTTSNGTLESVQAACSAALENWISPMNVGRLEIGSFLALHGARVKHSAHFEETIWAFHPEEEDLGEYDNSQLVGDVNHHEANLVNRTAEIFLAQLSSEHLLDLFLDSCGGVWKHELPMGDHLRHLKGRADQLSKLVEQVSSPEWVEMANPRWDEHHTPQPGLAQRAILWARNEVWEYPCRQKLIFDSAHEAGKTMSPYLTNHPDLRDYFSRDKRWDGYYAATIWHCVVEVRQMLQENVAPLVRQTHADIDEALALYNTDVEAAAVKLQRQIRRLLAGRGWVVVERAEIGMSSDGHWYEPSTAGSKPLVDLQEVIMRRKMILPLDQHTLEQLKEAESKLGYTELHRRGAE